MYPIMKGVLFMSFDGAVEREFSKLTEDQQRSIFNLMILFNQSNLKETVQRNNVPYDVFEGGLTYIADDFDETPEGFEEYM